MSRTATAVALATLVLVGACAGDAPAPSASSEPAAGGYRLRATLIQALAPEQVFGWVPAVVVTDEPVVVMPGPVPAIFPGPLLPNLRGRPLSELGWIRIVDAARELGLLTGDGDFTPPTIAPGAQLGRIEIVADGRTHMLIGDPNATIPCIRAPCNPPPASPEAFGTFWGALADPPSLVGAGELGEELAYRPLGFSLLIGVAPPDPAGPAQPIARWPLARPLADLGRPVGNEPLPRCATIIGEDATVLFDSFEEANQLTRWADPGRGAEDAVTLVVRPLLPGENACAELFGIVE